LSGRAAHAAYYGHSIGGEGIPGSTFIVNGLAYFD